MPALLIRLDDRTNKQLEALSLSEGIGTEDCAARLLRRAILSARPRRIFDPESVRSANAPFEAEDLALADSDAAARYESLLAEDAA